MKHRGENRQRFWKNLVTKMSKGSLIIRKIKRSRDKVTSNLRKKKKSNPSKYIQSWEYKGSVTKKYNNKWEKKKK